MKKTLMIICCALIASITLVGCSANKTSNLAKDLDATVKNFVVAVSALDWPEDEALDKLNNLNKDYDGTTQPQNVSVSELDTDIDTSEIYTWLEILHSKINVMLSKRADLLLYINEIHGGNTKLSETDQLSLKVYMNILKDNSNYLTSYKGMLKNQIAEAQNLYNNKSNINAINAYIIKAVETLQVRSAKIDTSILAMNSIIDIISNNLINNYLKYNEHNITESKTDVTLPHTPKQENTTQNKPTPIQEEQPNNSTPEDIADDSQDNQTSPSEAENAIDFNSDTIEVDGENAQPQETENLEDSAKSTSNKTNSLDQTDNAKNANAKLNVEDAKDGNTNKESKETLPEKGKTITRETIREKVV